MKNLVILINVAVIIGIAAIFTDPASFKSETRGHARVSTKAKGIAPSDFRMKSGEAEFVTEFIREMAEARMMDLEEGKIAQQRCTTKDLKLYGTLMVNDQTEMLKEIGKLAALKKVSLPTTLGVEKSEDLKNLKDIHGKTFDKKFVKMMISDHKRDVRKFEEATRSSDADVQVFATRYLPYVQSHLEKIRSLK